MCIQLLQHILRVQGVTCQVLGQVKSGQVSTGFFEVGIEWYQKDRASGSECHFVQIDPMGRGASGFGSNFKGSSNVVPFLVIKIINVFYT